MPYNNENWAIEAVNKALELEERSLDKTASLTKNAVDLGIGSAALLAGLVGTAVGSKMSDNKKEKDYKKQYGNAVAKILNEQNKKMIDMGSNYYTQIENIKKDLKIMFTPVSVIHLLKNTVIDVTNVSIMNARAKEAWKTRDSEYFKNTLINKIYLDAHETEQHFIKRLIEQDEELKKAISKGASEKEDFLEKDFFEVLAGYNYLINLIKQSEYSEALKKYANILIRDAGEWEDTHISLELEGMKYATDTDLDLGISKLSFLWFNRPNITDLNELTPDFLRKNLTVVYLPDRVLYVTDNIVVSQLNVTKLDDEGYDRFVARDSRYFLDDFFRKSRTLGKFSSVEENTEEVDKSAKSFLDGPLKDLDDYEEKTASKKFSDIENAFEDHIAKKVAYMIANSHEYKTPNVKAGITFAKNYKWEVTTEKVKNLQGINKPIIPEKVKEIAKTLNPDDMEPLVIVNQLHGIRPQTPGKKILMDGHHRVEAAKELGIEEVPVYKGTYTGKAERSLDELKEEKTAAASTETSSFYNELFTRKGIHPKVYYLILMKQFETEWLTWDMETLINSVQDIFGVEKLSDIVANKLMTISLVLHSDAPYTGFHTFEKVVRALNDKPIDFLVRESNISLGEIVNAIRIMADLIADKDDNIYDNFSEHTLGYLVEVLIAQNYRVCAHSTKSPTEKAFWDLVNLELLESWIGSLPTGLLGTSKESGALEARGIQRLTKEICDLFRGKADFSKSLDAEVTNRVKDFGFAKEEPFKDIIKDNVTNSLAADFYVQEMDKIRDEQIKEYL